MTIDRESIGQRLRRLAGVRLGRFAQDPPQPVDQLRLPETLPLPADPPEILIVTPSLNQGQFIGRTIRSVLDQAYPALTYRIQDGGSTDSTHGILESLDEESVSVCIEPDSGQADAINRGFQHPGDAEILAWLNADDILLPGALAHISNFFDRHPEVDAVYGNRLIIDEYDRTIGRWILPDHDMKLTTWIDYIPQETMFWRRRAWTAVGGELDSTLQFALDWDLILRMQEAGCTIRHIPRMLGGFRVHETQKTQASYASSGKDEIRTIRRRHWRWLKVPFAHIAHLRYLHLHRRADRLYRREYDSDQDTVSIQGTP